MRDAGVQPQTVGIWTPLYQRRWRAVLDRAQRPPGLVTADDDPKNDFAPYYARLLDVAFADIRGFLKLGAMYEPYHPQLDRLGLWPLPSETHGTLPPPPVFP